MSLDARSEQRLIGVHPDLADVVRMAASKASFIVTEGMRTTQKQAELVRAGASQTMKSRHLTGHAVDLAAKVNGEVRWDWPLYEKLNAAMQDASGVLGVPIEWGGSWKTLKDGPHFQLPWKEYP